MRFTSIRTGLKAELPSTLSYGEVYICIDGLNEIYVGLEDKSLKQIQDRDLINKINTINQTLEVIQTTLRNLGDTKVDRGDITTEDLNSILSTLIKVQKDRSNSTMRNHYPVQEEGGLISLDGGEAFTGQIFQSLTNRLFTRIGKMSSDPQWQEIYTTLNKPSPQDVGTYSSGDIDDKIRETKTETDDSINALDTKFREHNHDDRYYRRDHASKRLTTENLNDYTTGDIIAVKSTCINVPEQQDGILFILPWDNARYCIQLYCLSPGTKIYYRTSNDVGNNVTWSKWVMLYDNINKPTPQDIGASPSDHNHDTRYFRKNMGVFSDFNLALTEGQYNVIYSGNGTFPNAPLKGNLYGTLFVYVNDGTTHDNSGNWIWQILYTTTGACFWRYKINNENWQPWRRDYNTVYKPSPADIGTYTKAEIDDKDTQVLTNAKSYVNSEIDRVNAATGNVSDKAMLRVDPPSSNNCNDFLEPHAFFNFNTSNGAFSNTPFGTLQSGSNKSFTVLNLGVTQSRLVQEFNIYSDSSNQNMPRKYIRSYHAHDNGVGGDWSEWTLVYTSHNKPTPDEIGSYSKDMANKLFITQNAKTLSENIDLVTKGGYYAVRCSNTPNLPITSDGYLLVMPWDNENGWATQIFVEDITCGTYIRTVSSTQGNMPKAWSQWAKMYTSVDKPTARELGVVANEDVDVANTPNKIVKRDASGNISAKSLNTNKADEGNMQGAIAFRRSGGSDLSFCNSAEAFRTWSHTSVDTHNHDDRYLLKNAGQVTDFNNCKSAGTYIVNGTNISNAPYVGGIWGSLFVQDKGGGEYTQLFIDYNGKLFTRFFNNRGVWTAWNSLFGTQNKPNISELGGAPLNHNHDDRYLRTNKGNVSDFNNCLEEGKYSVYYQGYNSLPNAPYTGVITGVLFVYVQGDIVFQDFYSGVGYRYYRVRSAQDYGRWTQWAYVYDTLHKPNLESLDVYDKGSIDTKFSNIQNSVDSLNRSVGSLETDVETLKRDKVNRVISNPPLWEGRLLMGQNDKITPSKPLDQCENGYLLLWSDYDDDTDTINNFNYVIKFIPKWRRLINSGNILFQLPTYEKNNSTVVKCVSVTSTQIVGSQANTNSSDKNDVILRAVYEI